ncbi:MAG: DNA topoisomerase 3 [Candidatus Omnitrophota bacterium]
MKTLILTEKPSVAQDFAKSLGVKGKHDGYIENIEYAIAWAIGHLVALLEPQEYDAKWKKWSLETLPILPESFQYKPIAKTQKQFHVLQKLLTSGSFDRIVIATDAGREGEVIARTILLMAGFEDQKKLFRFWSSLALTPQVIAHGLKSLQPLSDYDRLWQAGQSRQIADWLVGMNFSRAATVSLHDLFSVGRVQTAVLALLVDRRREIDAFKPVPYWLLTVQFANEKGEWIGTWFHGKQTRFEKKEDAERILSKVLHQTGAVLSVSKQKKRQPPPLLYSLTDLQQDANKKFGFTAQETLDVAQKLYEKRKCLSYPRTDAKVLGTENVGMAQNLIRKLSQTYPPIFSGIDNRLVNASNRRVFNNAKLTDHHALIPLAPLPPEAGDYERKIYDLVLKRFAAAFYPDCEYEQTEIIASVENETFRTKGKTILQPGWRAVYGMEPERPDERDDEPEQENLPPLQKDDPAHVRQARLQEKKTAPPPEYTEALLLKDMTNPGKYASEEELKKIYRGDVGLGTQSTRAQIIEVLLKRKYIQRKKTRLLALEKGCFLIDSLRRFSVAGKIASTDETARWERQLERMAQGEKGGERFLENIGNFVKDAVQEMKTVSQSTRMTNELGNCPQCGGKIIEGKRGFGCSNWKKEDGGCSFVAWKTISGKEITPAILQNLLSRKKIGPLDGFVSSNNQPCSAFLKLVQSKEGWSVELEIAEKQKEKSTNAQSLGCCPDCGGEIIEGKKGYGCENWREENGGCQFVIWKTIAQKKIPKKAVSQLLKGGKTDIIQSFKSKEGKSFSARLKLMKNKPGPSKIVFEFSHHAEN